MSTYFVTFSKVQLKIVYFITRKCIFFEIVFRYKYRLIYR